jgi:hypothetical protein
MRLFLVLILSILPARVTAQQSATLRPFESDAEILTYFRSVREAQQRQEQAAAKVSKCMQDAPPPKQITRGPTASRDAVINGRVTDDAGKALGGVVVSVSNLGLTQNVDSTGRYRFDVPAESLGTTRTVVLEGRRVGYARMLRSLKLGQRDSVELDVKLCASPVLLESVVVGAFAAQGVVRQGRAAEAITNVQHAGVDEGDIVKVHGNHLVILRRGRLFTLDIGNRSVRPVGTADAFGPGIDPEDTWYDELLIGEEKVVVIGYSYDRGGTEIGVFRIDDHGGLRYQATYQLRSNDYYSSRNYASRLIGTKLIFYAPLYLWGSLDDPMAAFPAMRRWDRRNQQAEFRRIAPAPRVYRPAQPATAEDLALHTVTICDLAADDLACNANVVVGPSARVFYVSQEAVYVWASPWRARESGQANSMLYRMPLDGSAPSALRVAGSPVDQFSFLESDDGTLNVVVRSDAFGEAMWRSEYSGGDVALLQVPLTSFGDGSEPVPWWRYHHLPALQGWSFENRFVGDHLLYGLGSGWGRPRSASADLYIVRWRGGVRDGAVTRLDLPHGVDRIEVMGQDALVVGADAHDLHFTAIRLGKRPAMGQRYTLEGASQGELRSHGFFYRSDADDSGVFGLPISSEGRPGYRHLFRGSAGIVFVRNDDGRFVSLGVLAAQDGKLPDDRCRASCVDWYGNARPIFLRGRVLALLGYEIVEGAIAANAIRELQRANFTPGRRVVTP